MSCSGLAIPSRARSRVVMICSGRALLFGSCLIREPVMMIALPSGWSGAAVAGWAATVASLVGVSAPVGVGAWPGVLLPGGGVVCAAAFPARKNDVAASAVPDASSRTHFALWPIPAIPLLSRRAPASFAIGDECNRKAARTPALFCSIRRGGEKQGGIDRLNRLGAFRNVARKGREDQRPSARAGHVSREGEAGVERPGLGPELAGERGVAEGPGERSV